MKTGDTLEKKKLVRTLEDIPLFPYSHVRMENERGEHDSIEAAQFDFVKEAGQPNQPTPLKKKDS